MKLIDIVHRTPDPEPWSEGDNIPWHEPGFSSRMLREHLTQEHDAASRRFEIIDRHVAWIDQTLLQGKATSVLDLGCGPGLYSGRLAKLGHACTGIDYSPASLEHAKEEAQRQRLAVTYIEADIRHADYGTGYGLAMLIYGELNIFRPVHARQIITKAFAALAPGGLLLLEPHTFGAVRQLGEAEPSWFTATSGLFSDRPHLVLTESRWEPRTRTSTIRHYVIDAVSCKPSSIAQSFQAYTDSEYQELLAGCGFAGIEFAGSLEGGVCTPDGDLLAIVARKPLHPPT